MTSKSFIFTKDYLDSIAQAGLFTYQADQQVIQADDVVMWVYMYSKNYIFFNLFWSFLWCKNPELLQEYINLTFKTIKKVPVRARMKFQLTWLFKDKFQYYRKQGVSKVNFLTLLLIALEGISPQLVHFLQQHNVEVAYMKEKLKKILEMTYKADLSPIDFFKMLDNMVKQLGLDVNQVDMFVDMKNFSADMLQEDLMMHANPGTIDGSEDATVDTIAGASADEAKKLTIEYFGTDLTDEAKKGFLDPVIGRQMEIEQIVYTLLRKTKNNPLLIGEAGVGKTAIVEGLAQAVVAKRVPDRLCNKRIFMLDMWSLLAGTKYRGEFEARLKTILEEAADPLNNIILFIDEIHTIIGAWNAEGSADAANMLKPLLSRGKVQLIGATTFDEYQKHIEKDPALKRRFQEISVAEPSRDDAITILTGLKDMFEEFHGVRIEQEAIEKAVDYSIRYQMNKHLPDKAIDLIDEACARVSTIAKKLEANQEYQQIEESIGSIKKKIEQAIDKQDYFVAAELKEKEEELKKKLKSLRQSQSLPKHLRPIVTLLDIGRVLADKMGIPLDKITDSEIKKLAAMDAHLKTFIHGQDEAVDAVVKAIRRNRISLVERNKPIASFLFLGPSGVGKTYLAKLLAKEYFGDEKAMIRVDMSEFMEKYSVSKLIGSAPGYVGYEEGGVLTEQVRRKPYSVVLFDEIEKASPDVLNVLLQLLDEGHLKDNKGRWIDFKHTIIILTSNMGSDKFGKKLASIGFVGGETATYDNQQFALVKEKVLEVVKERMAPELINRLNAMLVFKPLTKVELTEIFKTKLALFYDQWKVRPGIRLPKFDKKRITQVIDKIYDPQYGARPVERYLHDELEPELIEQVMNEEMKKV
jgi:ATP-dependent Clp protease ATP-binding subunit ClpC